MTVLPSQGSYFVSVDYSPLGFAGDDIAFCRHITEQARVTAIPLTAFYDAAGGPAAPGHYARFAFCKADATLDEALARLQPAFPGPARGAVDGHRVSRNAGVDAAGLTRSTSAALVADVAQLVERRFVVPVVAGSIPSFAPGIHSAGATLTPALSQGERE